MDDEPLHLRRGPTNAAPEQYNQPRSGNGDDEPGF